MGFSDGFHELVKRAQVGDRQAVEQLLAVIRPWLEQQARGYADSERPDQSASDLTQEAWLRAWQKLDQFQGGPDDEQTLVMFRAWLRQIVRHLGLNAARDRAAQHRQPPGKIQRLDAGNTGSSSQPAGIDPVASGGTPSANVGAEEEAALVRAALEQLPDERDREIVRLRFFEGLSLRQIAERLQLDRENVRQRYHSAMRQLEHQLGEQP